MTNPIFHLYQLQKLDSRLDFIHDRVNRIVSIIGSDSRIKQAEESLSEKKATHRDLQARLRDIEAIIKEKRVKIEQSESSLYGGGIKTQKNYRMCKKK
jgi:predicted  nucleic acid-binding Zn-ribbon protein